MALPVSSIPVVLFPLKLETRFVADELWIRAFPDVPFLQGHDPRLSKDERQDARLFKQLNTDEERRIAWEEMAAKYGVYRSAWIVRIGEKEIGQQEKEAAKKGEKAGDEEPSFYFKWLPDRLVFYLYRKGDSAPAYKAEGPAIDRGGLAVLGEGDEWIQDFEAAVKAGVGIKIKLKSEEDTEFEKVIVSGIRFADDPAVPAKGLADLLHNHQYTEGLSFLRYGTPTNNTGKAKSGHSVREEFDAAGSFDYSVKGRDLGPGTAGNVLAHNLGLNADDLKYVRNASLSEDPLNALYRKATWFALGAPPLFMLFGDQISNETHEEVWTHYARYVKARGPFASLKIGDQPYGILPVMNIRKALGDEDIQNDGQLYGKLWVLMARLLERWLAMVDADGRPIPRLGDETDTYTEMLKILSMKESSGANQIRALEYDSFREKLQRHLGQAPAVTDSFATAARMNTGLQTDLDNVRKNIESLTNLLHDLAGDTDRLFFAPLLSFSQARGNLIAFREDATVITDVFGDPVLDGNGAEIPQPGAFSFTQEDLGPFKTFTEKLKEKNDDALLQFTGELSLFTDLLWRSLSNAGQLYYREIPFEPAIEDLRGFPHFNIGDIQKKTGDEVKRGEAVLEIIGKRSAQEAPSKTIAVRAPFDGEIVKMQVTAGEGVRPGKPLFTLIDKPKYQAIKKELVDLNLQIIAVSDAIADLPGRKEAQREAIREALDLNAYRLDAWITSLAARRIDEMRSRPGKEKGIYFGAYGWVEHLKKDQTHTVDGSLTDIYREDGGIIHTPGPAQAVASAVFKNSFLSYRDEQESNPFTLNLTSGRLQKGQALLEGIRQGQQLEALLGYQLERSLHDHPEGGLHEAIYALRDAFPLYENTGTVNGQTAGFVQLSVVDGLKAIQSKENLPDTLADKAAVKAYIEKLEDTLDAGLDTLFYEAGYQVTQGNLSQAAAALDATKGEAEPPVIEALKTRIPGVGIAHKLAMVFPAPSEEYPPGNCRAFVEPALETWLAQSLGDMSRIGCITELYRGEEESPFDTAAVTLADLGIGYLDFLYLSDVPVSDGASELELRIWNVVQQQKKTLPADTRYSITAPAPDNCLPLVHALEAARYAHELINRCRPLRSRDITMEDEAVHEDRDALERIRTERLLPVFQRLKLAVDSNLTQKDTLSFLAGLDLETAKTAMLGAEPVDSAKLEKAVKAKIAAIEDLLSGYSDQLPFQAAFDCLQEVAKTLFGRAFMLLPPASWSANFSDVLNSKKQERVVGDKKNNAAGRVWGQERIENWVQGLAQVGESAEAFEDWQMVGKVWAQAMDLPEQYTYQVVQGPTLLQYPWVALSKKEIDAVLKDHYPPGTVYRDPAVGQPYPLPNGAYYPGGSESTVLYMPDKLVLEKGGKKVPAFGVVVEAFTEHIPDEKVNTGLSFHYNAPNSEPPQAILLAVHPKAMMESDFFWSEDDLRDILCDTMDLFKIRMVDLEAMQEYGYLLPFAYWLNV